jgi:hypothetical protein
VLQLLVQKPKRGEWRHSNGFDVLSRAGLLLQGTVTAVCKNVWNRKCVSLVLWCAR